jgi:DNA topoisomerase-2
VEQCVQWASTSATPPNAQSPLLLEYKEHHTDVTVRFVLEFGAGKMAEAASGAGGLEARLKLANKFSTSEY